MYVTCSAVTLVSPSVFALSRLIRAHTCTDELLKQAGRQLARVADSFSKSVGKVNKEN